MTTSVVNIGNSLPMKAAMFMLVSAIAASTVSAEDPVEIEKRIIEYVKDNMKRGEPLIVSKLHNEVFTSPEERAVLAKLNAAFFRIPLFIVEYEKRKGRLPTLEEISGQFDFYGPEEADVVLSVMEGDPRVPKFLRRHSTGELMAIDVHKIQTDERFNLAVERQLTGWVGQPAPKIMGMNFDGIETTLSDFNGLTVLVYVWFTNCPPCVKMGPELVALQNTYESQGFTVLGLNADKVLELQYDDAYRAEYARTIGVNYTNLHLTDSVRAALGNVNIFPTLFLVDREGTIVKHFVNFHSSDDLRPDIESTMGLDVSDNRYYFLN